MKQGQPRQQTRKKKKKERRSTNDGEGRTRLENSHDGEDDGGGAVGKDGNNVALLDAILDEVVGNPVAGLLHVPVGVILLVGGDGHTIGVVLGVAGEVRLDWAKEGGVQGFLGIRQHLLGAGEEREL